MNSTVFSRCATVVILVACLGVPARAQPASKDVCDVPAGGLPGALVFMPAAADVMFSADVQSTLLFLEKADHSAAARRALARIREAWNGVVKRIPKLEKVDPKNIAAMLNVHVHGTGKHLLVVRLGWEPKDKDVALLRRIKDHVVLARHDGQYYALISKEKGLPEQACNDARQPSVPEVGPAPWLHEVAKSLAGERFWMASEVSAHVRDRLHALTGSADARGPAIDQLIALRAWVSSMDVDQLTIEIGFRYTSPDDARNHGPKLVSDLAKLLKNGSSKQEVKDDMVIGRFDYVSFDELFFLLERF
jgi:hypothetical protein